MRSCIAVLLVVLCIGVWVAPVFAKTETVTGEVISLACYFENRRTSARLGCCVRWRQ